MSKIKRFRKFSAGVFCGCVACFLVFGCGGKGKTDAPEKKKQDKEVVRKIPTGEPQPETAVGKKPQAIPRPESPAAVSGAQKNAVAPGQSKQQPVAGSKLGPQPIPGGQGVAPVSGETVAPVAKPDTPSEAVPSPASTEEKRAEIDAVTREAGDLKNREATDIKEKQEQPPVPAEAVKAGDSVPAEEGHAETANEAAPVIDIGVKEGAEVGMEDDNLLGYGQEGEEMALEEGKGGDTFNPFAPLFQKEKTGVALTTSPDQTRKFITELEKIDIGQLTLEGIIQAQSGSRAIVTDASGKGYVVKEGTYVGLNSGTVEKIESDRIVIAENIGTRQTKTVLKLQKPAGE
jgi:hypothetical protein